MKLAISSGDEAFVPVSVARKIAAYIERGFRRHTGREARIEAMRFVFSDKHGYDILLSFYEATHNVKESYYLKRDKNGKMRFAYDYHRAHFDIPYDAWYDGLETRFSVVGGNIAEKLLGLLVETRLALLEAVTAMRDGDMDRLDRCLYLRKRETAKMLREQGEAEVGELAMSIENLVLYNALKRYYYKEGEGVVDSEAKRKYRMCVFVFERHDALHYLRRVASERAVSIALRNGKIKDAYRERLVALFAFYSVLATAGVPGMIDGTTVYETFLSDGATRREDADRVVLVLSKRHYDIMLGGFGFRTEYRSEIDADGSGETRHYYANVIMPASGDAFEGDTVVFRTRGGEEKIDILAGISETAYLIAYRLWGCFEIPDGALEKHLYPPVVRAECRMDDRVLAAWSADEERIACAKKGEGEVCRLAKNVLRAYMRRVDGGYALWGNPRVALMPARTVHDVIGGKVCFPKNGAVARR